MQSPTFRKIVSTKHYACRPFRRQELSKKFSKAPEMEQRTISIHDWDTGEGERQTVSLLE